MDFFISGNDLKVGPIPGDSATDPPHPPRRHPCQDEVVEDDEDEHGGDDGGGEGVDQLVVELQVQVQVNSQAKGSHWEDLGNSLFIELVKHFYDLKTENQTSK